MSRAICIFHGKFGRVALLDMSSSLVQHAHRQCHVLIKISGDDAGFYVRDGIQPLTDRDAVLINAWEPHYYVHPPSSVHTVILALYIEPLWLADIQSSLRVSGWPGFFGEPSAPVNASLRARSDEFATSMLCGDTLTEDRVEAMIFELMLAVIEPFSEWRHLQKLLSIRAQQMHDKRIKTAIQFMCQNLDKPIEMTELASRCGLSRAHFFAQFERCTNVTPGVFLSTLRVDEAVKRLEDKRSVSLSDISLGLGFHAQSHFTRFFRDHLGITPSEYKRTVDVFRTYRTDNERDIGRNAWS